MPPSFKRLVWGLLRLTPIIMEVHVLNTLITINFRLKLLERFSENTNRAVELATQTSSTFLYDPVNIIQTINRYTNGWMKLHKQIYVDNDLGWFLLLLLKSLQPIVRGHNTDYYIDVS